MLIVPRQNVKVPRLGLSELMAMSQDKGLIPRVKGWVQGTLRRLPDCPRCGASAVAGDKQAVRFDEELQLYVCDSCGLTGEEAISPGPIVKQVAQENLITREFWQCLWYDYYGIQYISEMRIFISNDDTGVHEMKGIAINTMNGTGSANRTASKNTTEEYYTYTYTFTAPASARIIRQIGMSKMGGWQANGHNANWKNLIASSVTELSSAIEQGTTETFEVVYKYQFSEVTP
jgi:hypothetical protein